MNLPAPDLVDTGTRVVRLSSGWDADLIGVPLERVLLTWAAESDGPDVRQSGYRIRTRAVVPGSDTGEWTEAEPVASDASIEVEAPGGALRARERREISISIATSAGWSEWSDALVVEAGLAPSDISASVIDIENDVEGPVQILRTEFDLAEAPASARLYSSALGNLDVHINGQRVGDSILTPGWNSYSERVLVDTDDITALLRPGRNAISVRVADGWYRGRMGFSGRTGIYGDRSGALVQLEAEAGDGSVTTIVTDESWRGGFGEIRFAGIYDGSTIDQREGSGDASVVDFDDSSWSAARTVPASLELFEPRPVPPVRVVAELPAHRLDGGSGRVWDLDQNIAGWVRITVDGKAGDVVTVRHAEVLEPGGALHTSALRTAKATDVYTLAADGRSVLEPSFTFHGFRYAEIDGDAEVLDVVGIAISSDLRERSTFSSSHPVLDRFHENVRWSQRDNFVSIPTDCPQRDERLGWTGDAQAFAPTASTLFDSRAFWTSWLRDLEVDQTDEGGVASVVPDIVRPEDMLMGGTPTNPMGRAGWADAANIVPFAVHESYGGDDVLRRQLSSMRRWVGHLRNRAGDGIVLPTEPFQYGDWLDPDAPGDQPWAAKVSSDYVANAFYVQSTRLLARAERLVGDADRAVDLDSLADRVAAETWSRWGREAITTQTGAALALEFGIAPESERSGIAAALAAEVRAERGRIATGFLGTPLVLFALSRNGYLEEAYTMVLRRESPSWLYQVDRGATTVWERWDAILPDGSIHSGAMDTSEGDSMISFNHYAYGAMIDWVYRTVAGLATDPDQPGYRLVHVAPRPASGLDRAAASIKTAYGPVSIDWRLVESGDLEIELTIPFGSEAQLDLPVTESSAVSGAADSATARLGHGTHSLRVTSPAVVEIAVPTAL